MGKGHHDPVERIEMAYFIADLQESLRALQILSIALKSGSEEEIKMQMDRFEYQHEKLWKYFPKFAEEAEQD